MTAFTNLLFRPAVIAVILFIVSLCYYGHAALNFPTLFNIDNQDNFAATRYIAEQHKLPVVTKDNKDVLFSDIGTTRSLRPPFTYIVSAITANLAEPFIDDPITRQRLGSPIIAALTVAIMFVGFYLAFSHLGLALSGTLAIALLPKFVFLASCTYEDIGAILSVSMMFSSIIALIKYRENASYIKPVLFALAFSLGLIFQTKYTAWLTLPWFGLFCLIVLKPWWNRALKLLPMLFLIMVLAGGWWLGFNMVNYGVSDPSALNYAAELQAEIKDIQPNRQGYASVGVQLTDLLLNHDAFLSNSYKSMIGYLQWLQLEVGLFTYLFYGLIFSIALVGIFFRSRVSHKESANFDLLVLVVILSQCAFYLHHNFIRDIQPQARYILPIVMPLLYLFLRTVEQVPRSVLIVNFKTYSFGFRATISLGVIVVCAILHLNTLVNYIQPSFVANPFFTKLKQTKAIDFQEDLEISSTNSLSYKFIDEKLELRKVGSGTPSLVFASSFCERLPVNAIVVMNVSSPSAGGLYLRLDQNHQGRYDNINWQSFSAGVSQLVFSVDSQDCTGAKITLAKNTYHLTLNSVQISELRVHRYGKPI